MRDGESMLERLLVDGGRVVLADAEAALGLPPRERLEALGRAVSDGAWDALLDEAAALYRDGFAPRTVAEQLGRSLRDRLFAAVHGGDDDVPLLLRAIDALDVASERFVRQNDLYALEVALLRTAAVATGQVGVPAAADDAEAVVASLAASVPATGAPEREPATRAPGEAAASPPAATATNEAASAPQAPATATSEAASTPQAAATTGSQATAPPAAEAPGTTAPAPAPFDPRRSGSSRRPARAPAGAAPAARFTWHAALTNASPQLKAFLQPAAVEVGDDHVTLRYDERHAFHHGQLRRREPELMTLVDAQGGAHLSVVVEGPAGRSRHGPRSAEPASAPSAAPATPPTTSATTPAPTAATTAPAASAPSAAATPQPTPATPAPTPTPDASPAASEALARPSAPASEPTGGPPAKKA
jgi:DNA polymerase-3 subunit gamma/tau